MGETRGDTEGDGQDDAGREKQRGRRCTGMRQREKDRKGNSGNRQREKYRRGRQREIERRSRWLHIRVQ